MDESILICHPGRCGSHWLLNILRRLVGLNTLSVWPETIPPHGVILGTRKPLAELPNTVDVLFLLRDPRDVETSMRFYENLVPGHFEKEADAILDHLGWFRWYLDMFQCSHTIRFEQLWADPASAIQSLLEAIGRQVPEETHLREVLKQENFGAYSGRRRGQEDPRSHYRKGTIGDWKSHWDKDKTAAFMARFGKEMRQLGYD